MAITGIAYAVPIGVADNSDATVALQLHQNWTGTVQGTLDGSSVNWYTGYGFSYQYGGETYHISDAFCVDPADATLSRAYYYIISLTSQTDSKYLAAAWVMEQFINDRIDSVTAQAVIWKIIMGENYRMISDSIGDDQDNISALVSSAYSSYEELDLAGYYLAISPGSSLDSSYGIDYQDYLFKDTAPVPEPATLFLLGSGLVGLAGFRRKKG